MRRDLVPPCAASHRRWRLWLLACCLGLAAVHAEAQSDAPSVSPAALQPFVAAKQTGDLQQLLAVLHRTAQENTQEAATALLYAGLSEPILADLTPEQLQQVLASAQAALQQMTDRQAKKVAYKATSRHADWRVRSMLLDLASTHAPTDKQAQTAIVKAISDSTDAVALKAIDMAGNLRLERAVPTLMRLVISKWGQQVGVGAAKATIALEKITGTTEPEKWHEWVNTH
jgi:hypothetical protein